MTLNSDNGISRAQFLRGAAATGAVAGLSMAAPTLATAARAAAQAAGAPKGDRPVISAFIRGLLGMDMPTLAAFLDDSGFDGAEVPVRANLSYIRPDQVADQLPRLADALARRGKRIYCVTSDIVSVDQPHAETLVKTVARLGIPRYRLGFLRYDLKSPIYPQRVALRETVHALAQMNQAYGVKGAYQIHFGAEFVGASVWDYYNLIHDLSPAHMAIVYDVLHATIEGGLMWPQTWQLVQPYLDYVSVKDFRWAGNKVEFVPLGTGQVDPAMFKQVQADYKGDYSVHIEHVPQADLAGNAAALARDLQTLRRLLAA